MVEPNYKIMGVYDREADAEREAGRLTRWGGGVYRVEEQTLHTPEEVHEWRPFVTYNIAKKMCIHCGDVRRVMELPRQGEGIIGSWTYYWRWQASATTSAPGGVRPTTLSTTTSSGSD